jgi:selenoprotein W-related protein
LAEKVMKLLKAKLSQLVLIPSDGGRFEVSIDSKLVYSKLKTGRFPEWDEIRKHL